MSNTVLPLPSIVRASAWDAGNASMRAAGRSKWNEDDWNAAAEQHNSTVAICFGEGPTGCIKFAIAEQLQEMGVLTIDMKADEFFATIDQVYEAAA